MNIDITARNFSPSPYLKTFIHEKLNGLLKYDSNITSSKVVLLKEGRAEKVELILKSKRTNYITKCYSSVFEKTFINAIDKIKVQIKKHSK
tara:strand:+ start:340 stop:612 length:273 start_codon:yes stop_codon:yes gene_type:complete